MKTAKYLLTIILTALVIFTLSIPAFAEGPETFTISVENTKEGHTYQAYQIFSGNVKDNVLSNIEWGSGITEEGKTALQTAFSGASAEEVAANLNEGNAADFASQASAYLNDAAAHESTFGSGVYSISGLEAGYYLVKDKDGSLTGHDDAYTNYIVKVVGNSTVTPKSSVPSIEKKVKDINDSVEENLTDWQDSADHDIGDEVPFLLRAKLGDNLTGYETYKLIFHDTLSEGLTFTPASVSVKIDGTPVDTSAYIHEYSGTALTFTLNDVLALGAHENSIVTVEYTAKLNESAVIGSLGNPNLVYLEYSNNPNLETETGNTPKDKVIVFTYKVTVNKTDGTDPLEGAGFTLSKKNTAGEYVPVGSELKGDTMTEFTWTGIDDGQYRLEETTTPQGYNTAEPIEFVVTAQHDILSDDPALTDLTGGDAFTGTVETGALVTEVVNNEGSVLPGTGGSGTTIFYIVGGVLVLAAVIFLVARKLTNNFGSKNQ